METILFWSGCGLGAYGALLRQVLRREDWVQKKEGPVLLHLLFMTVCGAMIGFLFSASTELYGPSPRWPLTGAVIGFAWGIWHFLSNKSAPRAGEDLLTWDMELADTSFSAIILAAVIMYAVLQAFKIPSGSMEDTLLIGDHLFVNKFIYGIRVPLTDKRIFKIHDVGRGDVVVFEAPQTAIISPQEREHHVKKDFIKRAVGLPGDTIEIKNKHLFVNGVEDKNPLPVYKDRFTYPAARLGLPADQYQALWEKGRFVELQRSQIGDNFGPIKVPAGCYFVMGDNRDGSFDSRFWGPLPDRLLKGKAWIVYFGWGKWPFGLFPNWPEWPFARVKVIH